PTLFRSAHDQERTSRSAAADPPAHRESSPPQEEGIEASSAQAVLQELLEARARAWSSGSSAVLDEVFAPGAPMHAADLAALEKAAGFRYEGLALTASGTRAQSERSDRSEAAATPPTPGYEGRN